MGRANTPLHSAEDWKQKYLSSLERLECSEKQWAKLEKLLRSAIRRLTLAADGVDPVLDHQLAEVRRVVRNVDENSRLSPLVNDISRTVKRLEQERSKEKRAAPSPKNTPSVPASTTHVLLDIVDRMHVPARQSSRIKTLRKRINGVEDAKDLSKVIAEIAGLMAPHGWKDVPKTIGDDGDSVSRLQEILLQLLDYMGLPEDLLPRARRLEEQLSGKLGHKELTTVMQQIADLASQLRIRVDKEKREIEAFFVQLTDRLQDLGQHLQVAQSRQRASFDSSRELDQVMRSQVQDIESSVNKASNLEQLKQAVQARLDVIRNDLDVYRRSGEQDHERMEREVEALTRRLQEMENECTELRERAKREHMQAVSDALTGIFNRSAYEARLEQEYARWKRYSTPFSLMLWDVDGFKAINDTYGHTAGDNALRLIAGVLENNLRDADFIARYGGDEFAALLSETDLDTALVVAEKIHQAVIDGHSHHRGTTIPITLSCGVASVREGDTQEAVFERADAALYRAKRQGKNQCESEGG
ncbi:MAG: diguanylate cyclase [Acidiferrobacterales bacterium]